MLTFPAEITRDIEAIKFMSVHMEQTSHLDVQTRKDLGNRISQAMGRLADWEDTNPDAAKALADQATH
jgi:hypothetical protein